MHSTFPSLVASAAIPRSFQSNIHFHQCLVVNVTSDNIITSHISRFSYSSCSVNYNFELAHSLIEKTALLLGEDSDF